MPKLNTFLIHTFLIHKSAKYFLYFECRFKPWSHSEIAGKIRKYFWYISNTKRKLLDFVSYISRIKLYSTNDLSRVSFTFVRPFISPAFLVIWYSLQSDFSFVLKKHLPWQIHFHLTKKNIFCEENLKELAKTNIVKYRLMPRSS